jgi:cell wall hydrolase
MVMRQLRIRGLPATEHRLGDAAIIALIVLALFWGYKLRQVFDERDYLVRTIAFEAFGETDVGKVAVAYVVVNRKKSGRWGDSIKAVVTYPGQFEPWMTRRKEIRELSPNDPRYQSAALIADAVLGGLTPEILPQGQLISSTQSSFGRGAAVHYRHGPLERDGPSAGTPSIPPIAPHRSTRPRPRRVRC